MNRPTVGADPTEKSLGQLMGDVVSDVGTLVRQEIALAKVETKEELGKAGKAAGAFGGGRRVRLHGSLCSCPSRWHGF